MEPTKHYGDNSEPEPLVCEDVQEVNLRRLASAVVLQSLRDLRKRQAPSWLKADAVLWLTSQAGECWIEWAGLGEVDPYQLLAFGRYRKVKLLLRGTRHAR